MTATSEYQRYAEECLRWAEETDNDEHRQAFLDMAVVWMKLAAHGPNGELRAVSAKLNGAAYQASNNPEIG
jgi:hypothetical protein